MAKAKVTATREDVLADLTKIIGDAEQLLKSAAQEGGEQAVEFRAKVEENLALAKQRLIDLEETFVEKSKVAVQATDSYVHEHPWQTVGIFAGLGVVLGLLLNRHQ